MSPTQPKPCPHGDTDRRPKSHRRNGNIYHTTYCRPCETQKERERHPGRMALVPAADAARELERFLPNYPSRSAAARAYAERFQVSYAAVTSLFFSLAHGYGKRVQGDTFDRLEQMT